MVERAPADYIVVGIDIIKYSQKSLLDQKLAQERIDRCINGALEECQDRYGNNPSPHWIDAGDGGFALFQWAEQEVLEFLAGFYQKIDRENRPYSEENHQVLVRSAIHKDQVVAWTSTIAGAPVKKFTGHAINNCVRLMAGMIKEHNRQVVCSRPILDALMIMDRKVSPTRLKDIKDKHGLNHEVWNLCIDPILGVRPIDKELHPEPFLRIYPGKTA